MFSSEAPVPTGQGFEVPFYPGHIYAAFKPVQTDKVLLNFINVSVYHLNVLEV